MKRRYRRWAVLGPASLIVLLAGCSGPVTLDAPKPPDEATAACRGMLAATPDTVDGHDRRETEPVSDFTAAWGDPAITVVCGVAEPDALGPASQCFEVNGVGWFAERREQQGEVRFTTIGREAVVQAVVPTDYAPEANPLVDLAAPIKEHVAVVDPCV